MNHRAPEPEVYLWLEPQIIWPNLTRYLNTLSTGLGDGYAARRKDAARDAELAAEVGGRISYASWAPGINPNVTKVRETTKDYLANILRNKDESVLAHCNISFIFANVSRAFTEELSRHQIGTQGTEALHGVSPDEVNRTQESFRYVRLDDMHVRLSTLFDDDRAFEWGASVQDTQTIRTRFSEAWAIIADTVRYAGDILDNKNGSFHVKKAVTNALRLEGIPMGAVCDLVYTMNVRAARYIIEQRSSARASEEMRDVFTKVGNEMIDRYPLLFQDFAKGKHGEWWRPGGLL